MSMAGSGRVRARKSSLSWLWPAWSCPAWSCPAWSWLSRLPAVTEPAPSPALLRAHRALVPHIYVVLPEHGVGEHGEAQRGAGRIIGKRVQERQHEHEDARQPVWGQVAPVAPDPVTEERQVERSSDEAVGYEQQPELARAADCELAAGRALRRGADGDRLRTALLLPGIAIPDDR